MMYSHYHQRLPEGECMWLGVGEEGLSLLKHSSLQLFTKYAYASIVTFGGCQVRVPLVLKVQYREIVVRLEIFSCEKSSQVKDKYIKLYACKDQDYQKKRC
jgi:hypothetical protein